MNHHPFRLWVAGPIKQQVRLSMGVLMRCLALPRSDTNSSRLVRESMASADSAIDIEDAERLAVRATWKRIGAWTFNIVAGVLVMGLIAFLAAAAVEMQRAHGVMP